ncbi:MAG TPA: GDSL-type esterase/lipase family protein [Bacteroidales bacterium]|nr:GDSL-type esterase/lipase family protein [Bacteroidales bacterium]
MLRKIILFAFLLVFTGINNLYSQSDIWVGSWSCAPYAAGSNNTPPSPYLENNTLRQVVRVSIGGDSLRVKFSNKTCSTPVTMKNVNLAVSTGGSSIAPSTLKQLTFNGENAVTMDAYSTITSDPLAFPLTQSARVAITIHYGQAATSSDMTSHVASRTDSYILEGDHSNSISFGDATITAHWFHINTIDVIAPDTAGCVGVLGNSITDGYGLSGGRQNRWTDIFSEQLLDDQRTEKIGVLNLGIGATMVSGSGPTTGVSRFKDDILSQSGLRWVIVFYGTNDIAAGASTTTIIDAYKAMIGDAHDRNIKVYGATITPFKGSGHYSEAHENVREAVNEWIRTPGNFDACIDFDKAIRDPDEPDKMLAKYSNDWLHPNVEGYAFLGKAVDLDLFTEIENSQTIFADAGSSQTVIDYGNDGVHPVVLDGSASSVFGGEISSYAWVKDGEQIAEGESPSVDLPVGSHTITLTITDYDNNTDTDVVVVNVVKDSGVWLEAECGSVGSLWNTSDDEGASNGQYLTIEPGNNSTGAAPADSSGLLSYTFSIDQVGTYMLYARLICPSPNDDSFWIKMDNGSFAMWNNIDAPSWQWFEFGSGFSLLEGEHTLTIGFREDGAKLDKLWITNKRSDLPDIGAGATNCGSSSIGDNYIPDINVYPNPVKGGLTIEFGHWPAEVSILNTVGRKVFCEDVASNDVLVDMGDFFPGVYYVKIKTSKETYIRKIIKS